MMNKYNNDDDPTVTIGLVLVCIAFSVAWKTKMTSPGGPLAKQLKQDAKKKKQRRRKRLKDFLNDDMLRRQMVKDFEANGMGVEECEEHMKELELEASRGEHDNDDDDDGDIQISSAQVKKEALRIIWVAFTGLLLLFRLLNILSATIFIQFVTAVVFHAVDTDNNSYCPCRRRTMYPTTSAATSNIIAVLLWIVWAFLQYGMFGMTTPLIGNKNDSVKFACIWSLTSVFVYIMGQDNMKSSAGVTPVDKQQSSSRLVVQV
mmetsp:Transcript_2649/g.3917  ORF Transcript_2649/g.3917 Transcript_2649/m.3917 type:complete len:261 (+) Transcript_2649:137-919(+)